jgi:hypothetical protein
VRIFCGFSGPPSKKFSSRLAVPPKKGTGLLYSVFTRRKRKRFDLEGESGNTVYFFLRHENSKGGEEGEGPFGPMPSAVIP